MINIKDVPLKKSNRLQAEKIIKYYKEDD